MLLNQCLAISFCFKFESIPASSRQQPAKSQEESQENSNKINNDNNNENDHKNEETKTISTTEPTTKSNNNNNNNKYVCSSFSLIALKLFEDLKEQNKRQKQQELKEELIGALERVEFAGFLLPSWLLISGTYDDLHTIKLHWARGQLRTSEESRIETIGKSLNWMREREREEKVGFRTKEVKERTKNISRDRGEKNWLIATINKFKHRCHWIVRVVS